MILGYQDFTYNVKDIKKAVKFYKELGFTIESEDQFFASLRLGNCVLGLHWTEGREIPKTARNSHGQECGGTLSLKSDDVSEDRKIIEILGGKILGEDDAPWAHMLVFEDLDGNVLKLMNPKF